MKILDINPLTSMTTQYNKRNINDMHPEVAQMEEKKSQYEYFIREREEFFKNKFPEFF